jgi:hypothetical protein
MLAEREETLPGLYCLDRMPPLYFAMGLAEISRFDHPVLQNYLVDDAYDETFENSGKPRPQYAPLLETRCPPTKFGAASTLPIWPFSTRASPSPFMDGTRGPSASSLMTSCPG